MNKSGLRLPSIRAMLALERVASLGNVTRAAEELNTSQTAVSRHLRQIEADLGVTLVTKSGRGIVLTSIGQSYAQEVSEALYKLRSAGDRASASRHGLTIACTHEVSHLLLLPRYHALKQALGRDAHIRIITCEYTAIPAIIDAGVDIVFEYHSSRPQHPSAAILAEEIVPAATPDFALNEENRLLQTPGNWHDIPRLSPTKENSGWSTWRDWFGSQGVNIPNAPEQMFDNYVYALEAATRGEGIVLAWRGFADRYLESGQLIPLRQTWLQCESTLYAMPTQNGVSKELVKKCIKFLSTRMPRQ